MTNVGYKNFLEPTPDRTDYPTTSTTTRSRSTTNSSKRSKYLSELTDTEIAALNEASRAYSSSQPRPTTPVEKQNSRMQRSVSVDSGLQQQERRSSLERPASDIPPIAEDDNDVEQAPPARAVTEEIRPMRRNPRSASGSKTRGAKKKAETVE